MKAIYDLCMTLHRLTHIEIFSTVANALYKAEQTKYEMDRLAQDAKAAKEAVAPKKTGS